LRAVRARLVLDDDRLIPSLPQFFTEDTRKKIGACARRERNIEPNGLLLPLGQTARGGSKGRGQKPSTVRRVQLAESIATISPLEVPMWSVDEADEGEDPPVPDYIATERASLTEILVRLVRRRA
jgi:hypothetical protein